MPNSLSEISEFFPLARDTCDLEGESFFARISIYQTTKYTLSKETFFARLLITFDYLGWLANVHVVV
jgi:hypothetical protein